MGPKQVLKMLGLCDLRLIERFRAQTTHSKTTVLAIIFSPTHKHVQRKGAAPLSGGEEQTARAASAYAQYACLLSLLMGYIS